MNEDKAVYEVKKSYAQPTPFEEITPGIWEVRRTGYEGDYNVLVKVYGLPPFYEVSVWDFNLTLRGEWSNNISVRDIAKFEFGQKLKELEG